MNPCPTCGTDRDATGRHLWAPDPPKHTHSPEIAWSRGCPACPVMYTSHAWERPPRHTCAVCSRYDATWMWWTDGHGRFYCPEHTPEKKA